MNASIVFLVRLVVGLLIALLLMRIFYPNAPLVYSFFLAAALIALSYVSSHFRNRDKSE